MDAFGCRRSWLHLVSSQARRRFQISLELLPALRLTRLGPSSACRVHLLPRDEHGDEVGRAFGQNVSKQGIPFLPVITGLEYVHRLMGVKATKDRAELLGGLRYSAKRLEAQHLSARPSGAARIIRSDYQIYARERSLWKKPMKG